MTGSGPPLVRAAHYLSHLEFDFGSPVWRHWIRELSRHNTYIRYDERGCGLSDRDPLEFSFDSWVSDLETVVDSLKLEKFDLLGVSQGGAVAIAYAAKHPDRVKHLVLYGAYARGWGRRVGGEASPRALETRQTMQKLIELGWGQDNPAFRQVFTSLFVPEGGPQEQRWFNELQRVSCSPRNALRFDEVFSTIEVTGLLQKISVPTLVLHARGDAVVPFEEGRLLASGISGARFVSFDGRNHILLETEPGWQTFLHELGMFLGSPITEAGASPTGLEVVKVPLLEKILPGGLRYGANYLVEFEPHSLWYETSLTVCAQALRQGIKTDYHTFTHTPDDIRRQLQGMGVPVESLEETDDFRIWDSYTVQTGFGAAAKVGKAMPREFIDIRSLKMSDWEKGETEQLSVGIPETDRRRLHVDDNTSVLVQFNDERTVFEHFRTRTVPYVRKLGLAAVHAVARGPYSEGFYHQFESFCDGILDFRAQELEDRMAHSMRVRVARGAPHDSSWRSIRIQAGGEIAIDEKAPGEPSGSAGGLVGEADELASFLEEREELDLSRYSVAGGYLRFDEKTRNLLKDFRQRILDAFESSIPRHENFLIWAPPGSGKTSFVRGIRDEIGSEVQFFEANLADSDQERFRDTLARVREPEASSICFVDEVDSKGQEA